MLTSVSFLGCIMGLLGPMALASKPSMRTCCMLLTAYSQGPKFPAWTSLTIEKIPCKHLMTSLN